MQGKWMGSSEQYYNQCEGARQGFLNSQTVQIDSLESLIVSVRPPSTVHTVLLVVHNSLVEKEEGLFRKSSA